MKIKMLSVATILSFGLILVSCNSGSNNEPAQSEDTTVVTPSEKVVAPIEDSLNTVKEVTTVEKVEDTKKKVPTKKKPKNNSDQAMEIKPETVTVKSGGLKDAFKQDVKNDNTEVTKKSNSLKDAFGEKK